VREDKDLQARVQKIGGLVNDLETIADPASRAAAKELVQLLMDLHGTGLERMLELVYQFGEAGPRIIDDLGQDPLVSSLLILYDIHPDDLQARVERKLHQIDSTLHKMGAEAKLISIDSGTVRLHARVDGHSCGSTSRTVHTTLEEAMYEAAPDLASLVIEGLEDPAPSGGFIALEKLMGKTSSAAPALVLSSEGID
jgi:Fe-S cluster biogenesis protein NfuA